MQLFNVHGYKKRHHAIHNEIIDKVQDNDNNNSVDNIDNDIVQKRWKRQPIPPVNNINYCCAMPKDTKLCKSLICGHE